MLKIRIEHTVEVSEADVNRLERAGLSRNDVRRNFKSEGPPLLESHWDDWMENTLSDFAGEET